jgi:hypothetical protein
MGQQDTSSMAEMTGGSNDFFPRAGFHPHFAHCASSSHFSMRAPLKQRDPFKEWKIPFQTGNYSSANISLFFFKKGSSALAIRRKVTIKKEVDIELLKKMPKCPLDSVRDIRKFSSNKGPRT